MTELAHAIVKDATSVRVTFGVGAGQDVILAVLDTLRSKNVVQFMTTRVLIGPLANSVEHVPLDVDTLVSNGGVVEGAQHVIDDLVYRHACVLPSVKHAANHL